MKRIKEVLSLMMCSVIVMCLLTFAPVGINAKEIDISESGLESTGNATFDAFIYDQRWTDGIAWGARKPCLSGYGSSGCAAYCADFVKYCYGGNSPRGGTSFTNANDIYAGDVIILGNGSDGSGHWFVVLKRNGNSLYTAEGNYSRKVRIGWNYTIGSANSFVGVSRKLTTGYHFGAPTINPNPNPNPTPTPDPVSLPEPDPHNPNGVTDACEGGAGYVHVRGWAFDLDNTSESIMVHVYIGGIVGDPNAEGHAIIANHGGRDDVAQAYNCGDNHAFYENIQTDKRGSQDIHLYAINIGSGISTPIGDYTVNISAPISEAHSPVGVTDACEGGTGYVHVRGWAFDPDNTSHDIFVHVYIGGKVGDANAEGHAIVANHSGRSDIDEAYHCGDHHAFYENITTKKTGWQEVHLYAINIDSGESVPIGDYTVNIIDPNGGITIDQTMNDYFNSTIDKVEVNDGNKLHVVGWTFAKAAPGEAALFDVYIGGPVGSDDCVEAQRCLAATQRTDVYDVFKSQYSNMGDRHGIDYTFTVSARGTYTLYFYAVDQTGTVAVNPEIGRAYNVTFSDPVTPTPDPVPIPEPTEEPTTAPTEPATEAPTETATEPTVDPDAPQLTVSDKTAIIGSTVSVDIAIENNPGIVGMTLDVGYDSDALTLTEVKDGGILGTNTHKPELTSPYTLSWSNDTATSNITANGVIATLVFKVSDDAELGNYPITLSYDYDNYDIYDVDIKKVKFAAVNGVVSVKDVLYGDVNGDGRVNNIDRVHLTRYLAKWADYQEINLANADVNDDGKVNNIDKVVLTRHLAKWNAYAALPCQP